jgi:2,3,4,5-tetrahydropyridine-2-carboxylate N-succinyltransferase
MADTKEIIETAWENRELLKEQDTQDAIRSVIAQLDSGKLRVAEPRGDQWHVHDWIKKAVVLYFPIQQMETTEVGPFEFHDKMKLKNGYAAIGVRVVPHAIARYGAYLARGVILMPSYVNIGAYVGEGTMCTSAEAWA